MNDCFLTLLIPSGRNNRKNKDVSRDDNRRHIQKPVKHLRWSFLEKQLNVFNRWRFSYYLFKKLGLQSLQIYFELYFIFKFLPCRETLITNSKHVSFISNRFTLAARYIYKKSGTIYFFKLITTVKKSKENYTVLFY